MITKGTWVYKSMSQRTKCNFKDLKTILRPKEYLIFRNTFTFFFLPMPRNLQDLSSPTRDRTRAPAVKAPES